MNTTEYNQRIEKFDSQKMVDILKNFANDVKNAIELGQKAKQLPLQLFSKEIIVLGMGGSAIAGDTVRTITSAFEGFPYVIKVVRSYSFPKNVDPNALVVVSSYSGNTEETISAMYEAEEHCTNFLCLTTGGIVGNHAKEKGYPCITLPTGFQPRAAFAYSFFPLLLLLTEKTNNEELQQSIETALEEIVRILPSLTERYQTPNAITNDAYSIASTLYNKLPFFFVNSDIYDTIQLRWRGQLQENAKMFAFGNVLPEMNHNEICSLVTENEHSKNIAIVLIRDGMDHPRVKLRFDAFSSILDETLQSKIITVYGEGNHLLTRIISLVHLGDWISFHCAMLRNEDPSPIPLINALKNLLSNA